MEAKIFTDQPSVFNHYVASHPHGDVLQTTHWGELKRSTGWCSIPLAVVDKGQIRASTLLLKRNIPILGACFLYSPRGPIYSNLDALKKIIQAGRSFATSNRALFWKMDPPLPFGDSVWEEIAPMLQRTDVGLNFNSVQPRFIMDLNIRPSLETLLNNMKSKTRYNIRYAKRKGVEVKLSKSKDDLALFYPLLKETAKRDNFTIRSLDYFQQLWDCLVNPRLAQLFIAYYKNQAIAGTIAFRLGKKAWYVYGATSNTNRNLQASYGIQWEMIQWAKGSGCHIYDFRGVSGDMDPDNALYGLYRFKDGFGARVVEYVGEYDLPSSTIGYFLWKYGYPMYNKLVRKK